MWIKTRSKSQRQWKRYFFVLSQTGVLSFYEKDKPRPHGLRGQIILEGATLKVSEISLDDYIAHIHTTKESTSNAGVAAYKSIKKIVSDRTSSSTGSPDHITPITKACKERRSSFSDNGTLYVITLKPKDRTKERKFLFDRKEEFHKWRDALQNVVSFDYSSPNEEYNDPSLNNKKNIKEIKQFFLKRVLSPKNSLLINEEINTMSQEEQEVQESFLCNDTTESRSVAKIQYRTTYQPTVQIDFDSSSVYKVCTSDPQGDENQDTLFTLQTKFLQSFRLGGGPNGRMIRGEEVVRINLLPGLKMHSMFDLAYGQKPSSNDVFC